MSPLLPRKEQQQPVLTQGWLACSKLMPSAPSINPLPRTHNPKLEIRKSELGWKSCCWSRAGGQVSLSLLPSQNTVLTGTRGVLSDCHPS